MSGHSRKRLEGNRARNAYVLFQEASIAMDKAIESLQTTNAALLSKWRRYTLCVCSSGCHFYIIPENTTSVNLVFYDFGSEPDPGRSETVKKMKFCS
jgi:hypothetical protein